MNETLYYGCHHADMTASYPQYDMDRASVGIGRGDMVSNADLKNRSAFEFWYSIHHRPA